ncbi:MAG: helix-turn-helix domain-containing protein [Lachnospiraceae bacterium]|nr:helix-turn-helix domain-containing protein [Lachnospiraceae bacterium]
MKNNNQTIPLICERMRKYRKQKKIKQKQIAELLRVDASVISKVEGGKAKDVLFYAKEYASALNLTKEETQMLLSSSKAAMPDSSALMSAEDVIEKLSKRYYLILIPGSVIERLNNIKDAVIASSKKEQHMAKCALHYIRRHLTSEHSSSEGSASAKSFSLPEGSASAKSLSSSERHNSVQVSIFRTLLNEGIVPAATEAAKEYLIPIDIITCDSFLPKMYRLESNIDILLLQERKH